MALLLQLERRARAQEDRLGLGFLMVNDSRQLLDYREALLWRADSGRIAACSGLAQVEANAPFMLYLARICQDWRHQSWAGELHELSVADVPPAQQPEWSEYLAPQLLWVPLKSRNGELLACLLFSCEQPLARPQRALLELLQDAYAHAWDSLSGRRASPAAGLGPLRRRPRKLLLAAVAALLLLALLPVRQTVLAPAEIVPREPAVLRAPLQAVVERILVQPNQMVTANEALVQLDRRELESRLESARQSLAAAEAQLRQTRQQALFDERAKAALAELSSRREQARTDVDYLSDNLERTLILAPRDGVAIFDDPSDWIGRPVALGERIMQVADPHDVRLEIDLPVGDAIELENGSDVRLFLNSQPGKPLTATLQRQGYRASPALDGSMAYRLVANFTQDQPGLRVGLKGTAKLYGQRTLLFNYLLRRPLAALRVHLGW
ncbi:multidrug transporter [Stutzerimonas kirkiae]|uniref:Multidrug transporter n=2 Tax=Stutzerimonas kirkiae TaxID=2211392 RepID=A0A4Q9RDU7_9GAMM|nr:multidrug transporter [Stutzerimonas kirkiae]TBV02981.1 multidrug transporter [Stutzerimonas kirkiae]TBV11228.1 multidrug transporter [Stutzerimonas kirkiae]TBV13096.1 multidrug transporter [Stutzerimonas kirkiae]